MLEEWSDIAAAADSILTFKATEISLFSSEFAVCQAEPDTVLLFPRYANVADSPGRTLIHSQEYSIEGGCVVCAPYGSCYKFHDGSGS